MARTGLAKPPIREGDGRSTRHQHRRQELLDAAVDYAMKNGLAELSLRPLASGLGVSHRTLLYHFETKDNLFSEIVRAYQAREQRRVIERGERNPSAGFVDQLRAAWKDLAGPGKEQFLRFRFEMQERARHQPDQYRDLLTSTYVVWPGIIERQLEREGVPKERTRSIALFVQAALHGLQLGLLNTGDRRRAEEGFQELLRTLELVLAAETAPKTRRRHT